MVSPSDSSGGVRNGWNHPPGILMSEKPYALWMNLKKTGGVTRYGNYATYEDAMARALQAPAHLYESPRIDRLWPSKTTRLLESESGHCNSKP